MKLVLAFALLVGLSAHAASFTCNYLPKNKDEDTTNYPTYLVEMVAYHALAVEDISSQESWELVREYDYSPTKANKGFLKYLAPNTSDFKKRLENAFEYMIVSPRVQSNKKSGTIKLAFEEGGGHGLYYDTYSCDRNQ